MTFWCTVSDMRLTVLLGFLLVACGGSPKHAAPPPTPDPIPQAAGASCKEVAAHLATLADRDPTEDAGKGAPIEQRCESDRWSDDARSCFATAQSQPELAGCETKLTDAQRQAFVKVAPQAAKPADAWGGQGSGKPDDASPPDDDKEKAAHHTRGPVQKGDHTSDPCEGGE